MLKRLSRSKMAIRVAASALHGWVQLVWKTGRFVHDRRQTDDKILQNHPQIVATWHGQFLLTVKTNPEERAAPITVIASRHLNGEVAAQMLHRFGVKTVRGAGAQGRTKKDYGGAAALRGAVRALADGDSIVMTADVPPGPARVVGEGIVTLARLSGRPVVPVAVATKRFWAFSSWSRFTINMPFSPLATVIADPIFVDREAGAVAKERARLEIERSLNDATGRAYAMVGATDPMATETSKPSARSGLALYRGLTHAARPLAPALLRIRQWQGKEDAARRHERYGMSARERPDGFVAWFHAASVGETMAVMPLIDALRQSDPGLKILLTTGTVTSAGLAKARLPQGAIHQYVPLDHPAYAMRFFNHWRPDIALFVESEIWPNLLAEANARGVPLVLVNGRMSRSSLERWRKRPSMSRPLFSSFDLVLAQNERLAERFSELGALDVRAIGNLKFDAPRPPADPGQHQVLESAIGGRTVFLAASTHAGEDELVADTHRSLAAQRNGLLTVIVPRHPPRAPQIDAVLRQRGLRTALRSQGASLNGATDIYIADTIGELGLFYSLADVAFIGGSLVPHGGQNPVEAIKWGAAVLTGPHRNNFRDTYDALIACGGCRQVNDRNELERETAALLDDPESREAMQLRANDAIEAMGGALDITLQALAPFLPRKTESSHAP